MIIGINASYLAAKQKTGIENFSSQLILNLLEDDPINQYYLFSSRSIDKRFLPRSSNYKLFVSPFPKGWHKFRLPLSLMRHRVDIFMDPGYSAPAFISVPSVVFIHDLAFKFFPDAYSARQSRNLERTFRIAQKKAKAIIFSSQNTKTDFEKYYPGSFAIKQVLYQVYPEAVFSSQKNISKDILKLNQKYILFVGRIESRKNISNLIKAYVQLRHKYPEIKHKLVLAGKPGYGYDRIHNEIASIAKFKDDIIETGFIPETDLPHLYTKADLFVFPSLYEGFGIPLLEAFFAKTPIAASNGSSIPEIGGNAINYFNPLDAEDISLKIVEIISDSNLRKQLISNGSKRLIQFSWKKYHYGLLDVINKVMAEK